ncbi:MAG: DNA alkylation repair protein [Aquamicrobium sp.]|uniref:DNA alkylation repair protein n=1 Tax=Mesorhizobium sp. Pch-S TaxID=2082387 RepID=UPI00101257BE|nr:DNA alkylation repair protein [Mesorhizobium sp. Pch-S]MBR2690973.1 DNA alkylation repair protein [Aquamicrobium sp.]QAZ43511.1 DNA alkylation repair protein [Mesorhizobium sp. Pch-S]
MTETQAAPALKEIFDRARLAYFARETAAIAPGFDAERFLSLATNDLDALGIMQRLRQTAVSFQATLPASYGEALEILDALAPRINHGFASIVLPEFVALFGQEHFDLSMRALHNFTRYGSAEFAIRHFLARDFERTLAVMVGWAEDDNEHVRRLASEGSRPRLPWSFNLKTLIADPAPTAPILEALKSDTSLYVRKSVANHLNDITKDNPDRVIERVRGWDLQDARTAWIVKHALRTLIKKGDARALHLIGSTGTPEVAVEHFAVKPARIQLGERIALEARMISTADSNQKLVVDYAIHYVKKSGTASRKVFKLKEIELAPAARTELSISQVVRDFTTRKHHAGHHRVELIVNGEVLSTSGFDLAL